MTVYESNSVKTWERWNRNEIDFLKRNWRKTSLLEIRKVLPNHTLYSISSKAKNLGLTTLNRGVNELTDFERGWIAALVDGEGTITLHRSKLKNGGLGLHPRLMVGNNDRKIIEKLNEVIGAGHVSVTITNKLKPFWVYELSARPLEHLLKQIANSLIVKRERAKVAERVIKINERFWGGRRKMMRNSDFVRLKKLNEDMLRLNKK